MFEIIEIYDYCWDEEDCHHCVLIKDENKKLGKEILWRKEIIDWLKVKREPIADHFLFPEKEQIKKDLNHSWSYNNMVNIFWKIQEKKGFSRLYPNKFL